MGDSKKRLSAMLDADLERSDVAAISPELASGACAMDSSSGPTTFAEWFQVAPKEDLRSCLKALVAERSDVASQVVQMLADERAHQAWVLQEEQAWKAQQEQ